MVLMSQWTFYAVQTTTGQVLAELPLVGVSAQRSFKLGSFSATLPLEIPSDLEGSEAQRFEASRDFFREMEEFTTPAKYSIVVDLDGTPQGEWIIWRRTRGDGSYKLQGLEFGSLLDRNPVAGRQANITYLNKDQFDIARAIVAAHLQVQHGYTTVFMGTELSGVHRDAQYLVGDSASDLQRLNELSNVDNGFDWWFSTDWESVDGVRYVHRTLRFAYPRAGRDQPIVLDRPGPGGTGGNITAFSMDEDGTRLASFAYAYGAGEGTTKVIGYGWDTSLLDAGYPPMTRTVAVSQVNLLATADGYARALVGISRSAEIPPTVTILASGEPAIGDYDMGDRVFLALDPCPEFPDGWNGQVRILGWTLNPSGVGPATVTLEISSANDEPGTDSSGG